MLIVAADLAMGVVHTAAATVARRSGVVERGKNDIIQGILGVLLMLLLTTLLMMLRCCRWERLRQELVGD